MEEAKHECRVGQKLFLYFKMGKTCALSVNQ